MMTGTPSPTGSLARPWPSVVITSFGSTRNAICLVLRSTVPAPVIFTSGPTSIEIGGGGLAPCRSGTRR